MSKTDAARATKTWALRAGIGGTAALALVAGGIAVSANAATISLTPYDELDSPNPYNVTEGLVFYKAADMGWVVNTTIGDIDSIGYTVADGTSYAPSFQLVTFATRGGQDNKYGRLVWEPYMQSGGLNANTGTYSNVEDGLWWTNKIVSGPGSQSDPQPLSFFDNEGGAGWTNVVVYALDVHQGSTTDATSVVTNVEYNGDSIALGNADATPFDQADIDAAVDAATGPLLEQISGLQGDLSAAQAEVTNLQGQLSDALGQVADLQGQLADKQAALTEKIDQLAEAQTELAEAQSNAGTAQSAVTAAQAQIADLLDQVAELQDQVDSLSDQLAAANDEIDDLQADLADAEDHADDLQQQLTTAQNDLTTSQGNLTTSQSSLASALSSLAATQSALSAKTAELNSYKATHHTADGTSLGYSRAQLSTTPTHSKTVGVKLVGTIAGAATGIKYQWYLGGVAVPGATKSTYKVPSNAKGKTVSVRVTGTYKYMTFAVHSNTTAAK